MNCILCQSENIKNIGSMPSTYEWLNFQDKTLKFEIFDCKDCNTRFVIPNTPMENFYEFIFNQTDIYANQLEFARKLKRFDDPSWALLNLGHPYYGILKFLEGKKGLDILDVGCSFGQLTYVLGLMGHKAMGIDVSNMAVQFAKGLFGEHYYFTDMAGLIANNPILKFDLVVAIEVIEHLSKPMEFISQCLSRLREGGAFLFTTPNKDYKQFSPQRIEREILENKIWHFENPPVHVAIYGEKAIQYMAKENNCNVEFITCPGLAQVTGNLNLVAVFTQHETI